MAEIRWSPQYARSLVLQLYAAAEVLAEFPLMGRRVPQTELDHIREIVRDGYRTVYFVGEGVVEVLAVLHGRQDFGKKLRRE